MRSGGVLSSKSCCLLCYSSQSLFQVIDTLAGDQNTCTQCHGEMGLRNIITDSQLVSITCSTITRAPGKERHITWCGAHNKSTVRHCTMYYAWHLVSRSQTLLGEERVWYTAYSRVVLITFSHPPPDLWFYEVFYEVLCKLCAFTPNAHTLELQLLAAQRC